MVVLVSLAKTCECLWIVPDNHGLHTIGNGGLPRIVLPHSLVSAALIQRDAIAMMLPYRLPSKRTKGFTDSDDVLCALQNLRVGDRRHPKFRAGIPRDPRVGWTAPVSGHFVE
jgi:hypothetical protein